MVYLNLSFLIVAILLHLPVITIGRYASILAILLTIVSDNIGLPNINSIVILFFLMLVCFIYLYIFINVDSNIVKIILLILLLILSLPFGSMFPPR